MIARGFIEKWRTKGNKRAYYQNYSEQTEMSVPM
jgi:hypothetical protein